MAGSQLDLGILFQAVSANLAQNQASLNLADTYNHDHGDHMVDVFNMISEAVGKKSGATASEQLKYAGQQILNGSHSGSAQMYGENLLQAAHLFQGRQLSSDNAMQLVQALLGSQQQAAAPKPASSGGGLLGSLLSGLTGGQADEGLDAGDLLNAGMAFFHSKQEGDSNMEALLDAVVAASAAGQSAHRAQSGKLVANTLMQAVQSMTSK